MSFSIVLGVSEMVQGNFRASQDVSGRSKRFQRGFRRLHMFSGELQTSLQEVSMAFQEISKICYGAP